MKSALYPYTNDPINKGNLVKTEDVLELRNNVEKLLQDFHAHIGTTVNAQGSDDNPEIRQHPVATSSSSGFAPSSIYETLNFYEDGVDYLEDSIKYSLYPELSIVLWGGKYGDVLPEGWLYCDGQSLLYKDPVSGKEYMTPDLRYTEIVSVVRENEDTPGREFMSRETSQSRHTVDIPTITTNGEGMTKYYIIKKPIVARVKPTAKLTLIHAEHVKIATNYSYTYEGAATVVDVPIGADVVVSDVTDTKMYCKDKLYIKEGTSEETLLLNNTFKMAEDTTLRMVEKLDAHTLTINGTSNQTITVVCDGITYTSTTTDRQYTFYGDAPWTASVAASYGYNPGSINGATSGVATEDLIINATAATKAITHCLAVNAVHGNSYVQAVRINGARVYGPATLYDNTGQPTFNVSVGDQIEVEISPCYGEGVPMYYWFYLAHGDYPSGGYYPSGTVIGYNSSGGYIGQATVEQGQTYYRLSKCNTQVFKFTILPSHRYLYVVEIIAYGGYV